MTSNLKTAIMALDSDTDVNGSLVRSSSSFVCPYPSCRTLAVHYWGEVNSLAVVGKAPRYLTEHRVQMAQCEACRQEVIFVDGRLLHPLVSEAPAPSPDLPPEVSADVEEARQLLPISPRGAAALLRLALQKLLPLIGAEVADINTMIAELVKKGTVSATIQQALDSVRVIGNEAVHPGQMDLKDDFATARSLFGLINFITEKAITEPNEIAAIYAGLPANKLAGIANRDKDAKPQ